MVFVYYFRGMKHNILKLGKVFDLDTLSTDTYQIVLLENVAGLDINDLDVFDSTMEYRESDNYTRTTVPLELTATATGYLISVPGSSIQIPIETGGSGADIQGMLIIKEDTGDILSACLDASALTVTSELTIVFQTALCEMKMVAVVQ